LSSKTKTYQRNNKNQGREEVGGEADDTRGTDAMERRREKGESEEEREKGRGERYDHRK
jgi:hypothetical protein